MADRGEAPDAGARSGGRPDETAAILPASKATRRTGSLRQVNQEPAEPLMRAAVTLLGAIMRTFTRHVWVGQQRLPRTGGIVVVSNHISNADPLVLGQFLAYSGRWPRYLAKGSLFRVPVLGAFLGAVGQIPVQRESRTAKNALGAAVAAVEAGRAVVVYPEGTITADADLWPMTGKTGAARIALQTGCPVIPVGQWGAQEIMYGKRIHAPHLLPATTVRVTVGPPVALDDLVGGPLTSATMAEATDRIMDAITVLVATLRDEPAPAVRFDSRGGQVGADQSGDQGGDQSADRSGDRVRGDHGPTDEGSEAR